MRHHPRTFRRDETFEQWRQRLLDETSAYIEWGLAHPDRAPRIPTHPVGRGQFTERIRSLFWAALLSESDEP